MTARRVCWLPWANCTLVAQKIEKSPRNDQDQVGKPSLTWSFICGAGDGDRTRAVSLGTGE
jgi:hypothetical protein